MALLQGKNVLITGALGTIGRAMVARFAEEGASVIALDRMVDERYPRAVLGYACMTDPSSSLIEHLARGKFQAVKPTRQCTYP